MPKFFDALVDKRAHPGRQYFRGGIDQLHRYWLRFELFQHIFELSIFPVCRHHVRQEHTKTQTVDARVHGAIDIVAGHNAGDRDGHVPFVDPKVPFAAWRQTQVPDAAMLADIVWRLGNAVTAEVLLAGTHDAPHAANPGRHEGRILEVGDANPDIYAFLDQVYNAIDKQRVRTD